jgi:DNA polymerase III alpha subunit (gram-positive type)
MSKPEIYISIDIETDGPCAGINNMLSLGAVAFDPEFSDTIPCIPSFYQKIQPYGDQRPNGQTMRWWLDKPKEFDEATTNRRHALTVAAEFNEWLNHPVMSGSKLVAVAWPAAFDFSFVNFYCHKFLGDNPLGFACLDIRSYANGLYDVPGYYKQIPEGDLYKHLNIDRSGLRPHVALDDAIEQGRLFMAIRRTIEERADRG